MPQRGNLVHECVRVMLMRIEAGDWQEVLPGERRLAETLQVARDTVRMAIQQLERDGVLEPTSGGSRRRINRKRPTKKSEAPRNLRIGMLANRPLGQLSQPMLLEIDQIRLALAKQGGELEVFSPGWYEHKNPTRQLEAFIKEERCDAWLLFRSSEAVQRWFKQSRTPCLIRGYPHPDVALPHLDVDWGATARHAASALWRMGHRRVGVMVPTQALRGVAAAVKGVMELGEQGFHPFEMIEDGSVHGVSRAMARAMKLAEPPTAIIATRSRQVATALSWLAAQGMRVPADMSLISLVREPFIEFLVPEITGYRIDSDAVAKQSVRHLQAILAGNIKPGGNPWFTPEWVKGASCGVVKMAE